MKHLSLLTTLLLTSSMVYAGWTRYLDGGEQTPKGDCLEMICEYGCVEDDKGNGECCPTPTLENCLTAQFDEKGCPLCKCKEGYEYWNDTCRVKCDSDSGLKRDENGNCICDNSKSCCLCPKDYYATSTGVCSKCPQFDTSGWEKYCKTECKFTPDDPPGCCKMVVVDAIDDCWAEAHPYKGQRLGYLKGKYKITYIGGAQTNGRWQNDPSSKADVDWFLVRDGSDVFFISDPYTRQPLSTAKGVFSDVTELEKAYKGENMTTISWSGEHPVDIYRQDGPVWSFCGKSDQGCSDNCGQIKYLFEKECPENQLWDANSSKCVECFSKSDCPAGHYCSNGECLACPQRVEIPTYQGCKSTSDNRLCVIGTRIGSTSYKKNTQWVNPYQCTYNVYFSGTLDTKAKSKAHNKVYINGGHALGYDSRKYTYSDSYIGQLAPGGGVEVEIYNNSGRPCSSLSAWMTLAE